MTAHWYPIGSMRRLNTRVRVRWGWVEPFEAVLVEARPRRWATIRDGVIEYLPPKQQRVWRDQAEGEMAEVSDAWLDRRGWGPEPAAWQPLGNWPDPLPDPLPSLPAVASPLPRMGNISKAEFDAVAAAEEMEADRVAARNAPREERIARATWWLDPARIIYAPPGHVTREMAEGRILRALLWCGHGQDLSRDTIPMSRFLAEMASMTLSEALAADESWAVDRALLQPLKQDHGDFLEAMRWFCAVPLIRGERPKPGRWRLNRMQQVLLWHASARPTHLRSMAGMAKQTATTIARDYARAIDIVHTIANAPEAPSASLLALRARNRKAKTHAVL